MVNKVSKESNVGTKIFPLMSWQHFVTVLAVNLAHFISGRTNNVERRRYEREKMNLGLGTICLKAKTTSQLS